jgi:polysaccharide biosynthesis transport protein
VNNSIAVPEERPWPLQPYLPAMEARPGQRVYSAANILDLPTLLRVVQHWRWLILGAVVLGLVGGIIVTLLTTPVYRAWVSLEANPPTVTVNEEQSKERETSVTNSYDFVATQAQLISSKSVAQRTAQELNLANNPDVVPLNLDPSSRLRIATGMVQGSLHVIKPEEGQIIKFSFDSTSPQLAAMVANGVADSFINAALQRRYEASAYARNFLERQIAKTRGDLERSERQLVAYAQAQGIINTGGGDTDTPDLPGGGGGNSDANSLQGASLITLNKALADATARRVAAEGAYRQAQATGPTAEVTASTQALRQQRAQLEADYQQKLTFMKPEHPDMISLRSQINELDKQIGRESAQMSSGRTNTLLADYRAALSAERSLQARVAQLKGAVLNLRGRSIQYNILQREVDTNRSLYDALLQRFKEIGVAGGIGLAPVSIVDRADTPTMPFEPNVFLNIIAGLGLGLLAGLAGAVGLEFANDTIKTREDVRSKLSLPCLGLVPVTGKDSFVEELRNPASIVSEAYSAVVAALRFSTDAGMPKIVFVTSTQATEGKSSTALALAQNFARREKSVLLVDADLRKPAFRAANDRVGLSKLLTTEDGIDEHVVLTQHSGLWLLPSGPVPPNPADLLSTGRIRKVIQEATERFDLIVIDGPPTLGLADAPLLSAAATNVLFVVESGKTRTRVAIEALNRLEATGAHVLGAILTKATGTAFGYRGDRYGYGYGYGKLSKRQSEILMIPQGSES